MNLSKGIKYYVIATQGLLTMIVLTLIGYYIGYLIDKESFWPGVIAAIGAIIGLVYFIRLLLKIMKEEDKKKNESKD